MPVSILIVDDDDVAREAMIRSLNRNRVKIPIVEAEDGFVALQILQGTHPEKSIEKPFIVFLDLSMPRMDGFELLNLVRGDPAISDTVIYVLSTSDADKDLKLAYSKDIAGYLIKSAFGMDFGILSHLLKDEPETIT